MTSLKTRASRRGFTLIEVMIAMFAASLLMMGMGIVLVTLFTGMRESRDFADVTGRVDLVRQMTFDARTGDEILFPANDGDPGDYTSGGNEGDQVMFNSITFDPVTDTSADVTITWESRRAASSSDPYIVYRFIDSTPEDPAVPGDDSLTFAQGNITLFDVTRTSSEGFFVRIQSNENTETVEIELAVTLRNVIN